MKIRYPVCALVAALASAGCNPQPQHLAHVLSTPSPTPAGLPPLEIRGSGTAKQPVRITQQSGNRTVYTLVARSYESRSLQSIAQATFNQAAVTFFDPDGTTLAAHAPRATVDDRRKQVILSGGVHAKSSGGLTLTCNRLVYDERTALLHGDGNVVVDGVQDATRQELTGSTFTSDVKLTRMTMR